MAEDRASILLIDHGDLPSLTAAVIQPDPTRLVLWHRVEHDAGGPRRAAAVETHGNLLSPADVIVSETWEQRGVFGGAVDHGLEESLLLLQAAMVARKAGCSRIIWPVHFGPDDTRIGAAVDRAATIVDLAGIAGGSADSGEPGGVGHAEMMIDLPLVDLDDGQIVDLAEDAGAPLMAFWPCEAGGSEPCGSGCVGCDRWRRAFAELGLPWPWIGVRS